VRYSLTRRDFILGSAAAGAGAFAARAFAQDAAGGPGAAGPGGPAFKTKLLKAQIMGAINEKQCEAFREAGFEGIETTAWSVTPEQAAQGRKIAEKAGLKIHSVMRGWANLSNPKGADGDIASVEKALDAAAAYGADAILLVPCRTGVKCPDPWLYDYEFDAKTTRITRVVKGDNAAWAECIKAQNDATDLSRAALEKLIAPAEKAGVTIALENVWNNLWCMPDLFAAFVKSFDNKWIRAYFDIGNHVKYAEPQKWIRALGGMIVKCHVKDFKLNADGHGGKFVGIREGSVDWPAVRRELDQAGYNGWMTIEGGAANKDQSGKLDLIIAGK
jgi:hexulose-6-phosphate isomerase